MQPIIVWFRRDLRTDDNAALYHASRLGVPIIPLFIFDTDVIRSLPSDGAAFDFQKEALSDLARRIELLGGRLVTRHGSALDVHKAMMRDARPQALYYNRDYDPSARRRDEKVEQLYREAGVEVCSFTDVVVHEPSEVLKDSGAPYVVFTPYARRWKTHSHPVPFGKPKSFSTPAIPRGELLGAKEFGKPLTILEPAFAGGESDARQRWRRFLGTLVDGYAHDRDVPAVDGTSKLSAYLRFGCISPRRLLDDCREAVPHASPARRQSIAKYVDELIWREFYISVLFHFPELVHSNYREEFDAMPWKKSRHLLQAWQDGRTGFPLVDAGMRQLNRTGWMHNRVRMVVASFLTKDLRHDWRSGASYFEEKLMDIETASNNGGWQWAASTGVDPKPLRIFNPRLQSERFDSKGEYIKRFVPELNNVPAKFIHAPHTMPPALQKDLGCVIGKHYPAPIVDHAEAAAEYKRLFAAVKSKAKEPS